MALTPMMQQYLDIKEQYPDALLMFRLGDFYELFLEDATTASKALDITLTGRDAGSQGRVPMCGVPHHAAEQYIERLTEQGYSVAICEQLEDPKATKGIVKRDVVRVVTPGTILKADGANRRLLVSLVMQKEVCGVGFADVSTGDMWYGEVPAAELEASLVQWDPTEVLVYEEQLDGVNSLLTTWLTRSNVRVTKRKQGGKSTDRAVAAIFRQYSVPSLLPLGLEETPLAAEAVGFMLMYIEETQKQHLTHLRAPNSIASEEVLVVDYTASRNLELVETARGRQKKGSLYGLLDVTQTAMGSRLMRSWIERPLAVVDEIVRRQDAVEELVSDLFLRESLKEVLNGVYDLDRLAGKLAFGSANARDLRSLGLSLGLLAPLQSLLEETHSSLLTTLAHQLPNFEGIVDEIQRFIVEQPPLSVRDGGMIRSGVDAELDELRLLNTSGKEWLANLEQTERERTGIRTLKVGYNKVFGYYIEVSKANANLVPEHYERRQTLASGERYIVPELKEKEAKILHAEERTIEREYELFCRLRDMALEMLTRIQRAAEVVAAIDALTAFADVSVRYGFVRPIVDTNRGIQIVQGRHPVVEASAPGTFVPNDVNLGESCDLILITGPNMAGKSTYMRQTALVVLMAHIGCYVPAKEARIGVVDRIFTRIGASDDLSGGQSTFMVEMVELAQILRQATDRSLVLLDEIGRGTSTYDGMSIAEAVMEALLTPECTPLTLFATHYHELTSRADELPRAANFSVLVHETSEGISFLHTVVNRPADKSYGIQVAKLAGIPAPIIARAAQILQSREHSTELAHGALEVASSTMGENVSSVAVSVPEVKEALGLPLFAWKQDTVLEQLADTQIDNLTPLQAMNVLHDLVQKAREVTTWGTSKSSQKS